MVEGDGKSFQGLCDLVVAVSIGNVSLNVLRWS